MSGATGSHSLASDFGLNYEISFAHTSFKWANLAAHNAGVTVAIIGIAPVSDHPKILFSNGVDGKMIRQEAGHINAYLVPGRDIVVNKSNKSISKLDVMDYGNKPTDGGNLLLSWGELENLKLTDKQKEKFIKPTYGSSECIRGSVRLCIWVPDDLKEEAFQISPLRERFDRVAGMRSGSSKAETRDGAETPYKFDEIRQKGDEKTIIIPRHSSEKDLTFHVII